MSMEENEFFTKAVDPFLADQRQEHTLDRSIPGHTHTHIHKHPHNIHARTSELPFKVPDQPNEHVFTLWEESGPPGVYSQTHQHNMRTSHKRPPNVPAVSRLTTTPLLLRPRKINTIKKGGISSYKYISYHYITNLFHTDWCMCRGA